MSPFTTCVWSCKTVQCLFLTLHWVIQTIFVGGFKPFFYPTMRCFVKGLHAHFRTTVRCCNFWGNNFGILILTAVHTVKPHFCRTMKTWNTADYSNCTWSPGRIPKPLHYLNYGLFDPLLSELSNSNSGPLGTQINVVHTL